MLITIFAIPFVLLGAFLVLGFLAQCFVGFAEIFEIFEGGPSRPKKPWPKTTGTVMWVGALLFTLVVMAHQVHYLLH